MPLNVAPSGRVASAAPVTPAASCAATGAGALRLASQRIAAARNPSRVIVSPSPAALLVNLDVSAADRLHGAVGHAIGDLECVFVLPGVGIVLDFGHEAARIGVGAAHTRELRLGGADYRHRVHRAIEVRACEVVQVIQMAALRGLFRAEAEAAYAAGHVDLATAVHDAGRRPAWAAVQPRIEVDVLVGIDDVVAHACRMSRKLLRP